MRPRARSVEWALCRTDGTPVGLHGRSTRRRRGECGPGGSPEQVAGCQQKRPHHHLGREVPLQGYPSPRRRAADRQAVMMQPVSRPWPRAARLLSNEVRHKATVRACQRQRRFAQEQRPRPAQIVVGQKSALVQRAGLRTEILLVMLVHENVWSDPGSTTCRHMGVRRQLSAHSSLARLGLR